MRTSWPTVVAIVGVVGVVGCGAGESGPSTSGPASTGSVDVGTPAPAAAAAGKSSLVSFQGTFNAAEQRFELVYRSPITGEVTQIDHTSVNVSAGETQTESRPIMTPQSAPATSLNYGTGANQVYLHTQLDTVTYHLGNCYNWVGAADLWGMVTPVNGYGVPIHDFTAVIESISMTGAQFYNSSVGTGTMVAPPASADYFDVGANGSGTAGYFEFCLPTTDDFSFAGHIEGTLGP